MGVGVALVAVVTAPTSQTGSYLGERPTSAEGRLVVDIDFTSEWRLAANLSYRWRPAAEIGGLHLGPEVQYGLGVEGQPAPGRFGLLLEVLGSVPANLDTPYSLDTLPLEVSLGGRGWLGREHSITFGGGIAVIGGYGVPRYHAFLGYAWTDKPPLDSDGDGKPDELDQCPDDPEDYDDFEDADGCSDVDNDYDGVVDRKDQCPSEKEDFDRFQDYDGCPEPDNDRDGVLDPDDRCARTAEDHDGFQDGDGCPEVDNDRDGHLDADDRCPDEAETVNRFDDFDGCPDDQVTITPDGLRAPPIPFDAGSWQLNAAAAALLRQVSATLRNHPELELVECAGHTGERGSEEMNVALSSRRAESVRRYFTGVGVPGAGIRTIGYGETRPVAIGHDEAAQARNRRVVLRIIRRPAPP